jgi:hypothetical protein
MTGCQDVQERLSLFVDGDLAPEERAEIESHVASCAECRGMLQDLERVHRAAATLDPMAPPDHVWLQVAGQIRLDEAPAPQRSSGTRRPATAGQWIGIAAALVLLTLATYYFTRGTIGPDATVAGNATTEGTVQAVTEELSLALQHYENAIAELEAMAKADDDPVDLAVTATLRDHIRMIDEAITESREAVTEDPGSEPARDSLFEALRQKVIVLQATVTLMNEMRKGNQAGAAEAAQAFGKKS